MPWGLLKRPGVRSGGRISSSAAILAVGPAGLGNAGLVVAEVRGDAIFWIEDGDTRRTELGDEDEIAMGGEGGRAVQTLGEDALEMTVQVVDLDAAVRAVGDVQLGLALATATTINPDGVRAS